MRALLLLLAPLILSGSALAGKCNPGPGDCKACKDCSKCKYCNSVKPGTGCSVARKAQEAKWRELAVRIPRRAN